MQTNKNFIIAVVLSLAILIGWQVFYMRPLEQARRQQAIEAQKNAPKPATPDGSVPSGTTPGQLPSATSSGAAGPSPVLPRAQAIAATPRVKIDSSSLIGSINLKGGRIDDVVLRNYREQVDPKSEQIVLLSPSGSAKPFYAFTSWWAGGASVKTPDDNTIWQQEGGNVLAPETPVTLRYDNGEGLIFRRTITVDHRFMFTVSDEVQNNTGQPITLRPWAQVARHNEPKTSGYTVLHEGLIGILGKNAPELTYSDALKNFDPGTGGAKQTISDRGGWLGFTDQYWATVLIPDQTKAYDARLFGNSQKRYYTDFMSEALTIAPTEKQIATTRIFAGAKEVSVLRDYQTIYGIDRLDKLIDWGWFPFLTQPMFWLLDFFYKLVGNFGLSILIVTVLVKLAFFPLANKSYAAMSKMKILQPELQKIQERYKGDRAKQQQALMEIYKKEKINPLAGCLPILIQIPVFFALYKVLLVTIEMRHAPFMGWIRDLSAPDPTSIFNLFGLLPFTPPEFLMIGILPLLMGISMWVQMKLNPTPPDPIQQQIFTYMPIVFTFMLALFPAGLVLYWTWNNILSFSQQAYIMKTQGTEIDILENLGLKKMNARRQQLQARFKGNGRGSSRTPAE